MNPIALRAVVLHGQDARRSVWVGTHGPTSAQLILEHRKLRFGLQPAADAAGRDDEPLARRRRHHPAHRLGFASARHGQHVAFEHGPATANGSAQQMDWPFEIC